MDGQIEGCSSRSWRAGQWLSDGSLDAVAEINQQCLDYLVAMAELPDRTMPLLAGQRAAWRRLTEASRARLAAGPCLLVDAGFGDEAFWRTAAGPAAFRAAGNRPFFEGPGADEFIRRVLMLGWHLARSSRSLSRIVLGMSPVCATLIARMKLTDLDRIAEQLPGLVRARWEEQPHVWHHLLLAACDTDGQFLTQVSLRGLQLMAAPAIPERNSRRLRRLRPGMCPAQPETRSPVPA